MLSWVLHATNEGHANAAGPKADEEKGRYRLCFRNPPFQLVFFFLNMKGGIGNKRGRGGRGGKTPAKVVDKWWSSIEEDDPISLEPIADLSYEPINIRADDKVGLHTYTQGPARK